MLQALKTGGYGGENHSTLPRVIEDWARHTSGPAGTNMITGLYTCMADSIAQNCVTGQAPTSVMVMAAMGALGSRVWRPEEIQDA